MSARSLIALVGLTAALLPAAWAAKQTIPAADFLPNETQAATRADMIDLEFSPSRNMFTWCDNKGRLWVGTIDPVTGDILKPLFKMVDASAITPAEMNITTNGPEWVSTSTGDHLIYTKFISDPAKASVARLALAEGSADGKTWTLTTLGPDAGRNAPYASDDAGDTQPRISYVDAKNNHYWRNLYDESSEVAVKGMARTPKPVSVRFTKGYRGLVYAQDVNGTNQIFMYNMDSDKLVQLTNDAGGKDLRTVPWVWRAPEYNNKLVLMTTVDEKELRFYKGDGNGTWNVINSITLPEGMTVASPEPFTYNGKSYISLAVKIAPLTYPSAIYLAAVLPNASTKLWKVSDDTDNHIRMDPEVFITQDKGPVIFYNKFNPAVNPDSPYCADCSEGLFRATSGL